MQLSVKTITEQGKTSALPGGAYFQRKKMCSIILLGLFLSGCDDYPGNWPNEAVTMQPKPSWGDSISQEIAIGGDCNIDTINEELVAGSVSHTVKQTGSALKVSGWGAISIKGGVIASDIALAMYSNSGQGARFFATPTRVRRPDLASYYKNPASVDAGFKSVIDLSNVVPGDYVLEVIQHKWGKNYKCPVTANIIVAK